MLYLPLEVTRTSPPRWSPVATGPVINLAEAAVLVVDDDATNRLVMELGLKEHVAGVVLASSGEEALDKMATTPIDFVLTDISMPGMGGEALCQHIAQQWPQLPVVALTGNTSQADRAYYLTQGFAGVVAKPVIFAELLADMREVLPRR